MTDTLVLGAVAYDPKVVTIWEGFRRFFADNGFDFDFVLFSNYERQVDAHMAGHVDVAWNSPLAWIEAERLARATGREAHAIAMRDTDCDLTSLVVVRADSPIESVADLAGKKVAVGASDSPQATLIPLAHLAQAGVQQEKDFDVVRFEVGVGLHGDHVGGERDAAKALAAGDADAACMIDANHLLFTQEGTLASGSTRILAQTPKYDHCNFTVLDGVDEGRVARFRELLLGMSYDDAQVRPLLDLEGLKIWKDGRTMGYELLNEAVDSLGTLDAWLAERTA